MDCQESKKEKRPIIMDAKWKILDSKNTNYGISQGDMYQMYAYSKKSNANKAFVVYPYNESVNNKGDQEISYSSSNDDDVNVEIVFIDLENIKDSMGNIVAKINKCFLNESG